MGPADDLKRVMTDRTIWLRAVSSAVLNLKGQRRVDELLSDDNLSGAEACVLGGIDACLDKGIIGLAEAENHLKDLGVAPERALRARPKLDAQSLTRVLSGLSP
jgi:hypothetical protein